MRLGTLQLGSRLLLAPMSGITDYPFRRLAKEKGCGLVVTEMVSAEGLLRKKGALLQIGDDEHPVSVQLFGSKPETLSRAAVTVESMGADGIDINMGCPADQVVDAGAGADLMRFPEKVKEILTKVRKSVKGLLTIKIRSGWDAIEINALQISKIAEDCGVDAISIHPRTKVQGFRGRADWNVIRMVKEAIRIPVIGNGDVTAPFMCRKMIEETGCDAVMIGRGALGNPWIFDSCLSKENSSVLPSLEEKEGMIRNHFSLLEKSYGNERALSEIRKHLAWYTKGLPFSASFRRKLSELKEREALSEAITTYFDFVRNHPDRD